MFERYLILVEVPRLASEMEVQDEVRIPLQCFNCIDKFDIHEDFQKHVLRCDGKTTKSNIQSWQVNISLIFCNLRPTFPKSIESVVVTGVT